MRIEIDMNKVDYNKDFEHEDCLNELLELNCSYEIYYIADNDIIYLDNGDQLLNAYDSITDIFYLESDNFNINSLDNLSKCIEII
ncbi:hypothetical protein, partial [Staphylococcus phage Stab23]